MKEKTGLAAMDKGVGLAKRLARSLRGTIAWALVIAIAAQGCSSVRTTPVSAVPAEGLGKATVITREGYTYRFARVRVEGEEVIGIYHIVEESIGSGGEVAYLDVDKEIRLPVEQVKEIRTSRIDLSKTFLVAAGATLFGIWISGVLDTGDTESDDSNGGKPPIQ